MPEVTDNEFHALASRLTDPSMPMPAAADTATGTAAARRGRALMLKQYGSEGALEEAMRRSGRPRVGTAPKGASPTVRARISEAEFDAFTRLGEESGRSQSELVREAIHRLLVEHKLVS